MRILWITHFVPYPPKGGSLQRSYNLLKELAKYHDVWLVGLNQKALINDKDLMFEATEKLGALVKGIDIYEMDDSRQSINNYKLAIKSLFSSLPLFNIWLESKILESRISEVITANDIKLVHFDTIGLVNYLELAENQLKVLNHHNIESSMMLRRSRNETNVLRRLFCFIEGKKLQHLEKAYSPKFSLNLTCSSLDSDRLSKIAPKATTMEIPNGVDLDYFTPNHSTEVENTLIFAGGLSWYPNLSAMTFFLNDVWPRLKQRVSNIKLYIVGRNPPDWMTALAESDTNLHVTGFVPDVRVYLNKASIYICPISDGGGTKLKVLDALAMEKPLVAHPIACEGIDVINHKHVIFAQSSDEYLNTICNLLNDSNMRDKLGANGRALITEKYSFKSIGQNLANSYSALIKSAQ